MHAHARRKTAQISLLDIKDVDKCMPETLLYSSMTTVGSDINVRALDIKAQYYMLITHLPYWSVAHICTHTYTTHIHTHIHTYTHSTLIHAHIHTYTTHIHTHIHTHTHTQHTLVHAHTHTFRTSRTSMKADEPTLVATHTSEVHIGTMVVEGDETEARGRGDIRVLTTSNK